MEVPSLGLKAQSPGKERSQNLTSTRHLRTGMGDSHPGTSSMVVLESLAIIQYEGER